MDQGVETLWVKPRYLAHILEGRKSVDVGWATTASVGYNRATSFD